MLDAHLIHIGQQAKAATYAMARASTQQKNRCLECLVEGLKKNQSLILEANLQDRLAAQQAALSPTLIDRLSLEGRLKAIAEDILQISYLPDPIGEQSEEQTLPNGLEVSKCRTPIGVLGVIYESRPNVTIDVTALAIKTGNCAILRGGSETLHTNKALIAVIQEALEHSFLPLQAIQLISTPDRSQVKQLLQMHSSVDLIIPRGGAELHQFCRENSTIPVISGGMGICHLYVDQSADLNKATTVILNAKTQRPTVCNALDTLLIQNQVAALFLPPLIHSLRAAGVRLHLDEKSWTILEHLKQDMSDFIQAAPSDWDTEWLSLTLGIKVVEDLNQAIAHIRQHSTGHSDGILTQDVQLAEQFVKEVDSAVVYVNASTRFTDGGQLGLGAEVAISTQKLHARGPMGLKELTTYKWIVRGDYHTRQG